MTFISEVLSTSYQVSFLSNASNSSCIADTHPVWDNACLTEVGSTISSVEVLSAYLGLGLTMPTLDLVSFGWLEETMSSVTWESRALPSQMLRVEWSREKHSEAETGVSVTGLELVEFGQRTLGWTCTNPWYVMNWEFVGGKKQWIHLQKERLSHKKWHVETNRTSFEECYSKDILAC